MSDLSSNNADVETLAVPPRIAKRMLGCGITRLYELLNCGELQSYRDGKSRKIVVASLRDYVKRQLVAEKDKGKPGWTNRANTARAAKRTVR